MNLHIGEFSSEVRPVDDRSLLDDQVVERLAAEVARKLDARQSSEARRDGEAQLWGSVRSGTGR